MIKEGIVLGHKVCNRDIEVDCAEIETIEKLTLPSSIQGIQSLCDMLGSIEDSSKISQKSQSHFTNYWRKMFLFCLMGNAC